MSKLLILDGIGGVPLGKEIYDAFLFHGVQTAYYDCAKLKKIYGYALRAGIDKLLNRVSTPDDFVYLPKVKSSVLPKLIEIERPTHVLVIGFAYKFFSCEELTVLQNKHGFTLALYDTDSCNLYSKRREFIHFLGKELPIYDKIFSFSKGATFFFRETLGLKAFHFPYGAKSLPQVEACNKDTDVLFVGSCDLRRIFLLEKINQYVEIHGDRWTRNLPLISPKLQRKISDDAIWGDALLLKLTKAKIVLNITRTYFYGVETGINLRIFEALSAGCFLLTDYCDEIAELFEIGKEIEVFRSASELQEKVEYYLAHPEEREAIARCGHAKFLSHFTWEKRVGALIEALDI